MTVKALKVLIILDSGGWRTCQEIADQLNLTVNEVVAQIRILKRLKMVEDTPRTMKSGEKVPTAYRSRRFDSPKGESTSK